MKPTTQSQLTRPSLRSDLAAEYRSLGRRLRDLRLFLGELQDLRVILAVSNGEQGVLDESDYGIGRTGLR
jgi:hypothetical protein